MAAVVVVVATFMIMIDIEQAYFQRNIHFKVTKLHLIACVDFDAKGNNQHVHRRSYGTFTINFIEFVTILSAIKMKISCVFMYIFIFERKTIFFEEHR